MSYDENRISDQIDGGLAQEKEMQERPPVLFKGECAVCGEIVHGDLIRGVGARDKRVYILPNRVNLSYVKHCDPLDGVRVTPHSVSIFLGEVGENGDNIFKPINPFIT